MVSQTEKKNSANPNDTTRQNQECKTRVRNRTAMKKSCS